VQISGVPTREYKGNDDLAKLSNELKLNIMGKIRVGNKINMTLNGEWAKHVRPGLKKWTSKLRRCLSKKIIRDELKNL